jgi:hypothetical protein
VGNKGRNVDREQLKIITIIEKREKDNENRKRKRRVYLAQIIK